MTQQRYQVPRRTRDTLLLLRVGLLLPLFVAPVAMGAELAPSGTRANNDWFGYSVGISGETVYVGANLDDDLGDASGTVSVYRNISTFTGTVTENAKLYSPGESAGDQFGTAISLSGNNAFVTAMQDDSQRGSGWAIFDINATTPSQTKVAPAAPPFITRFLGQSASLSGNVALIAAGSEYTSRNGEAYIYRNLDSIPIETVLPSSAVNGDKYGTSAALSGDIALVGAPTSFSFAIGNTTGAVYMYRNLTTTPVETRILGFDTDPSDNFGTALSMSGTTALVGARSQGIGFTGQGGAAYLIQNLDSITPVQTKLVASDREIDDEFGKAVSLSGTTALIGASRDDDKGGAAGAAYLFFNVNLGGANATVTEDLKLLASNGTTENQFGSSVSIDGDNFVIGAYNRNSGRGAAYTGSVSSMSTMNMGNATRFIDGLSFSSKGDWIIGQSTDGNAVQLTTGDSATVTASGKAVYIGRTAGSDGNKLTLSGTLAANELYIGSTAGNAGNTLQLDSTAVFGSLTLRLSDDNLLAIEGDYQDSSALISYLGTSSLQVWDSDLANWLTITSGNAPSLITSSFSAGYTTIQAVPEPGTGLLLILGVGGLLACRRRFP